MTGSSIGVKNPELLISWKEIANYMGCGVRTVQRYERLHGLPVRRPAGKMRGAVMATRAEIDAWVAASPIRESFRLSPANIADWRKTQIGAIRASMSEMKELRRNMLALRGETKSALSLLQEAIRKISKALPPSRIEGYEPMVNTTWPDPSEMYIEEDFSTLGRGERRRPDQQPRAANGSTSNRLH